VPRNDGCENYNPFYYLLQHLSFFHDFPEQGLQYHRVPVFSKGFAFVLLFVFAIVYHEIVIIIADADEVPGQNIMRIPGYAAKMEFDAAKLKCLMDVVKLVVVVIEINKVITPQLVDNF
jgi:hypothetical protein